MILWTRIFTPDELTAHGTDSAAGYLRIAFTAIGPDWVEATMPLDARTTDSSGALAGGGMSILAETVASVATTMTLDMRTRHCVGQLLTVRHVNAVTAGPVTARASLLYVTEQNQCWQVKICDAHGDLACVAEMTMVLLDGPPKQRPQSPLA